MIYSDIASIKVKYWMKSSALWTQHYGLYFRKFLDDLELPLYSPRFAVTFLTMYQIQIFLICNNYSCLFEQLFQEVFRWDGILILLFFLPGVSIQLKQSLQSQTISKINDEDTFYNIKYWALMFVFQPIRSKFENKIAISHC